MVPLIEMTPEMGMPLSRWVKARHARSGSAYMVWLHFTGRPKRYEDSDWAHMASQCTDVESSLFPHHDDGVELVGIAPDHIELDYTGGLRDSTVMMALWQIWSQWHCNI